MREVDVAGDRRRILQGEGLVAGLRMMAVADLEATDRHARLLLGGLRRIDRLRRDGVAPQPGHRGHHLEHRARRVDAAGGPVEQRRVILGPIEQRLEVGRAGLGIDDQVGVVGRRAGHGQDAPGGGFDGHDRAALTAQQPHRPALQSQVEGQEQVPLVVRIAPQLAQQPAADAAVADAEELWPVAPLQAGGPEARAEVAHAAALPRDAGSAGCSLPRRPARSRPGRRRGRRRSGRAVPRGRQGPGGCRDRRSAGRPPRHPTSRGRPRWRRRR